MSDLIIIGAGAAGLAAAIAAGREIALVPGARGAGGSSAGAPPSILMLDGAAKPGAKILVSGGGRCNVTNENVTENDYFGGPRPIIRKVLRAFDERRTIEWMRSLGVELKLEPTGKYFPVTDSARTVLDALMEGARAAGVRLLAGVRVEDIKPLPGGGFEVFARGAREPYTARRVILAAGGAALPKSGSDGAALEWMSRLGHTIIPITPALAPLTLDPARPFGRELRDLAGVTFEARLRLEGGVGVGLGAGSGACSGAGSGAVLAESAGSMVLTHFGLSGPAALNLSRSIARRRLEFPGEPAVVTLGWPAFANPAQADAWLLREAAANPRREAATIAAALYPERLARLIAETEADGSPLSDADARAPLGQWPRDRRRRLAERLVALPLPVNGDRGYTFAEATAGGVNLREINPATMESRVVPGLHLCGEILDVDGRIGGFNFQWAWAGGTLAGRAAARAL